MKNKRICFIAQFPPPVHGLSIAVETLYNSKLNELYEFEKANIQSNKILLKNLKFIWHSKADLYYFTISQTKAGNLRDLMILKVLQIKHKKCLIHLHGGYYRELIENKLPIWQRKANYNAIQRLSGVIVLGNSLENNFTGMISKEKIFIVSNCVSDKYLMNKSDLHSKLTDLPQRKVKHVLYLSNLIKAKGYRNVLELAKLEKERFQADGIRKLHFDFAGMFYEKAELKYFTDFISQYELVDFVTYHGIVSGEVKKKLFQQSDLFILLTSYAKEGQPISILEAMGNGLYIVASDHAGIPDLVQDTVNGLIIPKENIRIGDLYNKMINLNDDEIKKIGEQNRNLIDEYYSQSTYIQNMRNVYRSVLK